MCPFEGRLVPTKGYPVSFLLRVSLPSKGHLLPLSLRKENNQGRDTRCPFEGRLVPTPEKIFVQGKGHYQFLKKISVPSKGYLRYGYFFIPLSLRKKNNQGRDTRCPFEERLVPTPEKRRETYSFRAREGTLPIFEEIRYA